MFAVRVADQAGKFQLTRDVEFLGPEARLLREEEEEIITMENATTTTTPRKSKLWLWVVAAFVVQATVWFFWIRYAAQHRVAEVPLVIAR
jgi:hypothetical protein